MSRLGLHPFGEASEREEPNTSVLARTNSKFTNENNGCPAPQRIGSRCQVLVRTVGNRAHPRPHHDSARAGEGVSGPASGGHLATNAGTDCAGAPTPGPEMREIESLVERFLNA